MRMVGTVALDGGHPVPGASAVALACDLCSAVAQAAGSLPSALRARSSAGSSPCCTQAVRRSPR